MFGPLIRRTRQHRRRASMLTGALACALLAGCAHTPSKEDRSKASAMGDGAAALLTEARFREALRDLLEAEKLDPQNAQNHFLLATVYFHGFQKLELAEKHCRLALEHAEEEYSEADNLLGVVLMESGRVKEAIPYFERAMGNMLYATPQFAAQNLGTARHRLGEYDEAVRILERALQASPRLCGAYPQLAASEEARGKQGRAIRAYERFFKTCDVDDMKTFVTPAMLAPAFYRFGMLLVKAERTAEARAAFQTCVTRFGEEPAAAECRSSLSLL